MVDKRNVLPIDPPLYRTWKESANWTIDRDWTWHDAWHWKVEIREKINISSQPSKDFSTPFEESFSIRYSKHTFGIKAHQNEALTVSDSMNIASGFYRTFGESWKISDSYAKHLALQKSEKFSIYDTIARAGRGVLSDILFEDAKPWTIESMYKYMYKGKHVGYEHFKPFINGDYTYSNALFRTSLEAVGEDRAMLEQFQIAVDVPDIVDRGASEVVDKNFELSVEFNRTFHIAPEVTVTMRSGSSGTPVVPNITKITEKGFTLYLVNALNGEKTTGKFVWTAVGY